MIHFHNVSKKFNSYTVLNNLSFEIPKGKITFIIGKSGEGKSVTLKHILGLMRPTSGNIIVDGLNITKFNDHQMRQHRRNFGVLFQGAALFDDMKIKDNILFPLKEYFHFSHKEKREKINELMTHISLNHLLNKYPDQLSIGEKKRAGLARALITKPKIILYDEPTTGMDPLMCETIDNLIKKISLTNKNLTSVVISHDLKAALTIADNILMLYNGKLALAGTSDDFRNTKNPVIRQFFSGKIHGPMTFL